MQRRERACLAVVCWLAAAVAVVLYGYPLALGHQWANTLRSLLPRTVMPCRNEELRRELVAMSALDLEVRQNLIARGVIYDGYHPEMEAIHVRNASRLKEILAEHGWPGPALVGDDGAEAAWLIVQHAIGDPALQRQCLLLLQGAAQSDEVPLWQAAMLEDRIRMFEGRPQIYGTQLETDSEGTIRPYLLEDPEHVEEHRDRVGLELSVKDLLERRHRQGLRTRSASSASIKHGCAE